LRQRFGRTVGELLHTPNRWTHRLSRGRVGPRPGKTHASPQPQGL